MSESVLSLLRDMRRAKKQGPAAVALRQRTRLAEMVAFARANSPYFRELYQGLPERIEDTTVLPVTNKKKLMTRFNDWVTDRDVTIEKVRAFVDNPDLVGERFLGHYAVFTTSGTTGYPGIFLVDDRAIAVNVALTSRMLSAWLSVGDLIRILVRRGRWAMVIATGGHFLVFAGATRLFKRSRWSRKAIPIRFFSVHTPLPEMDAQLNQFRPAWVTGYGSVISLLAGEQTAGRLRIEPVLVQPEGETLTAADYDRIATVFNAKVRDAYGATECPFLSYGCEYGWYHVNSDWVVVEPVDANYQPVPPGEQSHTVLLSNLANRVQPILRYDLGDGILERPDPCPCGNPLLAIRVQGRSADVLTFHTEREEEVTIAPLVFGTLMDRTPGVELFQIVQSTPTSLRVRLRPRSGSDPDVVWQTVHTELTHLLSEHGLDHVRVDHAEEPPEQSPGGKYRTIIPLRR